MLFKPSKNSRILASTGYIPLIGIIVLLRYRKNKFVVFNALQGFILSAYFLLSYLYIPGFGQYVSLVFVAFLVTGFFTAFNGDQLKIPFVSDFVNLFVKLK